MVWILLDAELIVHLRNFWIVRQEMQGLAIAEIGGDAFRIELAGVFEVFNSLLVLAKLTKERCVVQAGPEVRLVYL